MCWAFPVLSLIQFPTFWQSSKHILYMPYTTGGLAALDTLSKPSILLQSLKGAVLLCQPAIILGFPFPSFREFLLCLIYSVLHSMLFFSKSEVFVWRTSSGSFLRISEWEAEVWSLLTEIPKKRKLGLSDASVPITGIIDTWIYHCSSRKLKMVLQRESHWG